MGREDAAPAASRQRGSETAGEPSLRRVRVDHVRPSGKAGHEQDRRHVCKPRLPRRGHRVKHYVLLRGEEVPELRFARANDVDVHAQGAEPADEIGDVPWNPRVKRLRDHEESASGRRTI
jgi:hypothetical protein